VASTIFPDAFIVAIIRDPRANIYSLLKKYHPDADIVGFHPEGGWWGTKPDRWRDMVLNDKVEQCAYQWCAVNAKMLEDRTCVNLFLSYAALCADPAAAIRAIAGGAGIPASQLRLALPELNCFDREYEKGSRLRSKNRYYRELGSVRTPSSEIVQFGPFSQDHLQLIDHICAPLARELGAIS
jgi:hypothetical protein